MTLLLLALAALADPCLDCHREKTPGVVAPWAASAHAREEVGCATCHGRDYAANHPDAAGAREPVGVEACAPCHPQATSEHRASRHSIGFRSGMGCTRNEPRTRATLAKCGICHESDTAEPRTQTECAMFLGQPPAMQRQGCTSCHRVETGCDACHTPHTTDLAIVRDPLVCATCHMGPDHPQYEMWKTSKHGVAWSTLGPQAAPDCAGCHMRGGSHDVSFGLTVGAFGQRLPEDLAATQRADMVGLCARCHTSAFAARSLADGDAIYEDTLALVVEAAGIVTALDQEGLLLPAPATRPPNPLAGHALELGLQMVYQDLSRPEVLYFRLRTFAFLSAWKGAWHQSPDYTHWYGNAPLKLQLSELQSEAELLRWVARLDERIDLLASQGALAPVEADGLKRELRALKEGYLDGRIDRQTYDAERNRLLDAAGL